MPHRQERDTHVAHAGSCCGTVLHTEGCPALQQPAGLMRFVCRVARVVAWLERLAGQALDRRRLASKTGAKAQELLCLCPLPDIAQPVLFACVYRVARVVAWLEGLAGWALDRRQQRAVMGGKAQCWSASLPHACHLSGSYMLYCMQGGASGGLAGGTGRAGLRQAPAGLRCRGRLPALLRGDTGPSPGDAARAGQPAHRDRAGP